MRMHLIIVAKEHIKTMFFWDSGRTPSSAAPFPEATGCITSSLQNRSNRRLAAPQRCSTTIAADRSVPTMLAGHQTTTCGCTDARTCQSLSKSNPLARHLIDAGGPNVRIPKARQLVVTEFIGHDVNDVGFFGSHNPTRRQHQGGKEKQTHHHLGRFVES